MYFQVLEGLSFPCVFLRMLTSDREGQHLRKTLYRNLVVLNQSNGLRYKEVISIDCKRTLMMADDRQLKEPA